MEKVLLGGIMNHYHVGMGDTILRCSSSLTVAVRQLTSLAHGLAIDLEDGCGGRCGSCGWCRASSEAWAISRADRMGPMTRCLLNIGKTSTWEMPYINGKSVVIWAAPSIGSYSSCIEVAASPLPLHQVTISES